MFVVVCWQPVFFSKGHLDECLVTSSEISREKQPASSVLCLVVVCLFVCFVDWLVGWLVGLIANNVFVSYFQVLRVNTKYNILYVLGNCPGEKGSILSIRDSDRPHERPPPFPTYFPDPNNPLAEDMFADDVQQFDETIYFSKKEQTS